MEVTHRRHAKTNKETLLNRHPRLVHALDTSDDSDAPALERRAEKIGCSAETLRNWLRQSERDLGKRPGLTTSERERLKELERGES